MRHRSTSSPDIKRGKQCQRLHFVTLRHYQEVECSFAVSDLSQPAAFFRYFPQEFGVSHTT